MYVHRILSHICDTTCIPVLSRRFCQLSAGDDVVPCLRADDSISSVLVEIETSGREPTIPSAFALTMPPLSLTLTTSSSSATDAVELHAGESAGVFARDAV